MSGHDSRHRQVRASMGDSAAYQRGSYLILGGILLVILLVTAGLAVDLARKFMLEAKAQDVADAAALAGAQKLPDVSAARAMATTYIQQAAGSWYIPDFDDIVITVAADSRSGEVGVMVRGAWDPVIMPSWLTNDATRAVARSAIAVMNLDISSREFYEPGAYDESPGGPYALFVGDSTVGRVSSFSGNNTEIRGNAHFNHTADLNDVSVIDGTVEATSLVPGSSVSGAIQVPSPFVVPPILDGAKLVHDVLLDPADAYYSGAGNLSVYQPLLDVNGNVIRMQNDAPVMARWTGAQWEVQTANSSVRGADGGKNAGLGTGIDIKILGDVAFDIPNSAGIYWEGSIQCSGKYFNRSNNAEIRSVMPSRAVDGLDNPGLAFYTGYDLPADALTFDNGGNVLNVYGLLYNKGSLFWHGNMSNPASSGPGVSGAYDAVGNGFIKGSVYCSDMDISNGGGNPDNNLKIWYDGVPLDGPPVINARSKTPPRYSTPTVWLRS